MVKGKQGRTLLVTAVLLLSMVFSGLANAAGIKTIHEGGMELFNLRQAAEMYGYSIEWNGKERSVALVYMGKMDDMMMQDDKMMQDSMMMDDMMMQDDMMKNDMMMQDDMMMESGMKPAGKMITLWIDSKTIVVNGKKVNLDTAPTIFDSRTYVVEALITQYMMPVKAMAMNEK